MHARIDSIFEFDRAIAWPNSAAVTAIMSGNVRTIGSAARMTGQGKSMRTFLPLFPAAAKNQSLGSELFPAVWLFSERTLHAFQTGAALEMSLVVP